MSLWLKQSTARTIHIGPFVNDTDGKTAETGLTISQADVRLSKNGGDMAQKNDATSCTHDELGYYTCPLDTTDTNTLGHLKLMVHESGALPVFMDMMVVPANVWDSMFGADKLQVDVEEIDAIKAKTDTIGSLSVTITSPVATDGTVTIEQGDSYDVSGAAIVATIAKADLAYSLTGATIKLKTQQATITGAVSDDATNWYLTFSPTATQTAALTVVTSAYEIEATLADSKIKTVQRGTLRVNRDIPAVS